jgi:hypothetical protein
MSKRPSQKCDLMDFASFSSQNYGKFPTPFSHFRFIFRTHPLHPLTSVTQAHTFTSGYGALNVKASWSKIGLMDFAMFSSQMDPKSPTPFFSSPIHFSTTPSSPTNERHPNEHFFHRMWCTKCQSLLVKNRFDGFRIIF